MFMNALHIHVLPARPPPSAAPENCPKGEEDLEMTESERGEGKEDGGPETVRARIAANRHRRRSPLLPPLPPPFRRRRSLPPS